MQTTSNLLRIAVPHVWEMVRDVRASVARSLKDVDEDLRDAAVMTASELVENAIKYGVVSEDGESASLELVCDGGQLFIRISSRVNDFTLARATIERIRAIARASDPDAMYVRRLRELAAESTKGSAQLGLYRVCSEGGFRLSALLEGSVLHIIATRELS